MVKNQFPHIGFIGTGLMGFPMAVQILNSGYSLTAFNRSAAKAEGLQAYGAHIVDDPLSAIQAARCVFLMLTDAQAIEQVLFAGDRPAVLEERVVIQASTISPEQSLELQSRIEGLGAQYLEAPVMGGPSHARQGQLIALVGATPAQFDQWAFLLHSFSAHVHHVGAVGVAAALKLSMNHLIASLTAAFAFSLGVAVRSQVAVDLFMQVVHQSGLFAPPFQAKLPRMLERDYAHPNYPLRLVLKDVELMIGQAGSLAMHKGLLPCIQELVRNCVEAGWGEADYSALYEVINPGE